MIGGFGDDYVNGGPGQDDIFFFRGSDTLIGGEGDDEFFAYALDGAEPRGRQVFKYLGGNEGRDEVTGFNAALDTILLPEGTAFNIIAQGNDTLVEFNGNRVTLLACNCLNEVNVITDENLLNDNGNVGDDDLAPEVIAAISASIPLMFLALAAVVYYRRPRRSGDMQVRVASGTGRESMFSAASLTSLRTRGMSQWFYLIYGNSGRFSAQTEATGQTNTTDPYSMTFEEAEGKAMKPRGQDGRRPPPKRNDERRPKRKRKPPPQDMDSML